MVISYPYSYHQNLLILIINIWLSLIFYLYHQISSINFNSDHLKMRHVSPKWFLLLYSKKCSKSLTSSYSLQLIVFCKLQKVNLLMVGEYTEWFVLNCYIYKFYMILKLPISRRDNLFSQISVLDRYPIFCRINCLAPVYNDQSRLKDGKLKKNGENIQKFSEDYIIYCAALKNVV
ncbi:hypothetical protein HanPI659440_Chr04g0162091 [Helianthus annuus]|nr:hypothetical protein HanPI659440_Chr04g0162091 [Helianthus annuus]